MKFTKKNENHSSLKRKIRYASLMDAAINRVTFITDTTGKLGLFWMRVRGLACAGGVTKELKTIRSGLSKTVIQPAQQSVINIGWRMSNDKQLKGYRLMTQTFLPAVLAAVMAGLFVSYFLIKLILTW